MPRVPESLQKCPRRGVPSARSFWGGSPFDSIRKRTEPATNGLSHGVFPWAQRRQLCVQDAVLWERFVFCTCLRGVPFEIMKQSHFGVTERASSTMRHANINSWQIRLALGGV